ncbi:MAG: hypothetical protein Q9199_001986 [Rusavskia elegans]
MSIPLENTLADSFLHAPRLSLWEIENIDCRTLVLTLLDLNPQHEWHAYTPGALSSIYESEVSSKRMQIVENKSTNNLTVEDLHGLLSQRLPHVPDIATFCATFGVPRNALAIAAEKPIKVKKAKKAKTTSAKLNAGPVKATPKNRKNDTQWLPCDGTRILFVSMPQTKCNNSKEHQIQVETLHTEASKEIMNFSLSSGAKQRIFGLPLRFPTAQMHNAASHNLRTHLLKYDDDGPFQLNVADTYYPSSLVIPVVEAQTDDALSLLAIIVRFFPVGGHSPLYTFQLKQPHQPDKSLLVAAATCPKWLRAKLSTPATSNIYLSPSCTSRCTNCPQKVEIIECDLPRT